MISCASGPLFNWNYVSLITNNHAIYGYYGQMEPTLNIRVRGVNCDTIGNVFNILSGSFVINETLYK